MIFISRFLRFFFFVFSLVLFSIYKIYLTLKTAFRHIPKLLDIPQKYSLPVVFQLSLQCLEISSNKVFVILLDLSFQLLPRRRNTSLPIQINRQRKKSQGWRSLIFFQSEVWIDDPKEKKKLIEEYKSALK